MLLPRHPPDSGAGIGDSTQYPPTAATMASCDSEELMAMLTDMVEPPINAYAESSGAEGAQADAECAAASVNDSNGPTSACEERTSARESEAMKRPEHYVALLRCRW